MVLFVFCILQKGNAICSVKLCTLTTVYLEVSSSPSALVQQGLESEKTVLGPLDSHQEFSQLPAAV